MKISFFNLSKIARTAKVPRPFSDWFTTTSNEATLIEEEKQIPRSTDFKSRINKLISDMSHRRTYSGNVASQSLRYIPMHSKRVAIKILEDDSFSEAQRKSLLKLFRVYRIDLTLHWLRQTDMISLLFQDVLKHPVGVEKEEDKKEKDLLLNSLHLLADKANFDAITDNTKRQLFFSGQRSIERGRITIKNLGPEDFKILKIWVRGKNIGRRLSLIEHDSPTQKALDMFDKFWYAKENDTIKQFSKVVLVVQPKDSIHKDEKINIMLFKDIPISQLHLLLPGVTVVMSHSDKLKLLFLGGFGGIALSLKTAALALNCGAGNAAYVATYGTSIALALAASVSFQTFVHFHNAKLRFASILQNQLYEKCIAVDEIAIRTLVTNTESQELKEMMLAYAVLLLQGEDKNFTANELQDIIQLWIKDKFGEQKETINFDIGDALEKLRTAELVHVSKRNHSSRKGSTSDASETLAFTAVNVDTALKRSLQAHNKELDKRGLIYTKGRS